LPLGDDENASQQIMTRIKKELDGTLTIEEFENCSFVPMLSGRQK
jgi:hypothetical protein